MKSKENNDIWQKIEYQIQKEKLDKDYYCGKLTAEELVRLLRELYEKIYVPKNEIKKKAELNNPNTVKEALRKIEKEIMENVKESDFQP